MGPANKMMISPIIGASCHLIIATGGGLFGDSVQTGAEGMKARNAYAWNGCGLSGICQLGEEHFSAEAKIASSHPVEKSSMLAPQNVTDHTDTALICGHTKAHKGTGAT